MSDINYFTFLNNRLSIKKFLSICLIGLVTGAIFFLGVFNYYQMREQNDQLFKMQMVNSANAIDTLLSAAIQQRSKQKLESLLQSSPFKLLNNLQNNLQPRVSKFHNAYQDSFAFQVYDNNTGELVLHSSGSPIASAFYRGGQRTFRSIDLKVNGVDTVKSWNMFSIDSQSKPYRIVVLIATQFKHKMFLSLFLNALWDLAFLYLVLLLAIFIIVELALRPLSDIRRAISAQDPRQIEPIEVKTAPPEVIPLLNQLNLLFGKFRNALEREKRFAGDAAHELKTPLAGLKTQAEVALNLDDIDQIKHKIVYILISADRYFYIIDQLLMLSRLEPQQDLPDKKFINLNTVAENQLAELAVLALEKKIDLQFLPSKAPATVCASNILIGVLFRNLIDNAIRYTPEKGEVVVYSCVTNNQVVFDIVDDGIGIPEEKQNRIFDRFYRTPGTKQSGSGLGLSIAKEIVRLHDGDISAHTAEGVQGLRIHVTFAIKK